MSLAAAQPALTLAPSRQLPHRRISLAMRVALGLLHTGGLYRGSDGLWRCRAYRDQPVTEVTVRGLLQRGLVDRIGYRGVYEERVGIVLNPAGRIAYRGGELAAATAPPVAAEGVLAEIEDALDRLNRESDALTRAIMRETEANRLCRQTLARNEARLDQLSRARDNLEARRTDLRAYVDHAGERLLQSLQECGR